MQVPATNGNKGHCRGANPSILLWAKPRILNRIENETLTEAIPPRPFFMDMEKKRGKIGIFPCFPFRVNCHFPEVQTDLNQIRRR